uniref:phospholipase D n=1 Tax=Quercus lobata TaxID=97700 RepID=A0A7N2MZN3_QUELO
MQFGMMDTHDEETQNFFKNSSVQCILSSRSQLNLFKYLDSEPGIVTLTRKFMANKFLCSHHQKSVIVDTQASDDTRKITAFIGGLDLRDGRYDTPEHRLFRDHCTVYQNDYRNPTLPAGAHRPRQPWHDLHCKIEGPAAYDVLTTFEQLWGKAAKWSSGLKKCCKIIFRALMNLDIPMPSSSQSISNDDPKFWVSKEDDPENWHVQVFRSVDSGCLEIFPATQNLVVEKSIQSAYIQAIRSAQHFIYIENQFFLGSSYAWQSDKDPGANNLIPMELALKIASKIRAKERFAVYIVIPMCPEGTWRIVTEEVLFWQSQTMQMMYGIIARELKSMHLEDSRPQDYLNFYCLGKREELTKEVSAPPIQSVKKVEKVFSFSKKNLQVSNSQKFQRFMVYVHGKGMIVDDEYVILGSANINERSLDGSRDSEIAMGAYQPHQTWGKRKGHPHGQIYGYRMSLWAEHLGTLDDYFMEPETLGCIESVNKIAEENWRKYKTEDFTLLQGHLLKYPIKVDANGKVECLDEQETFPDINVKVLGSVDVPTISVKVLGSISVDIDLSLLTT